MIVLNSVKSDIALTLYYARNSRYGLNVLIGALEKHGLDSHVSIYLIEPTVDNVLENLVGLANRHKEVVMAFSILTPTLPTILNLIREMVRLRDKLNLTLIAGGPHVTGDPIGMLKLGFNYVFIGESEETFVKFLSELVNKGDVKRVPGIAYLEMGKPVFTGRQKRIDLNEYPPFAMKHHLYNPIEITRGCPFACKFCQTSYIFGATSRFRSIENTLYHVEHLLKRGMKDIRFITPNALGYGSSDGKKVNVEALEELLSKLHNLCIKYGGRLFYGGFPSEVRPEFVNEETLRILKRYTHSNKITIGAQSGSDRILKMLNRGHTVDDVENAVDLAIKMGFKVEVDFIFGLPGETKEDEEATLKLIESLASKCVKIHAHTFIPLPGTPLSTAPPGRVSSRVKRLIYKLIGRGKAYGYWEVQERIAKTIDEYRRTGIITCRPSP